MTKTLKQIILQNNSLVMPTLRNVARIGLHPTGIRDLGDAIAENLKLRNTQVGNVLSCSGSFCDATKYLAYGFTVGNLIYG